MDLQLRDRSILVTGGSSGIGLATAEMLIEEGACVTIAGRDGDRLQAALETLGSDRVEAVRGDVLDRDDGQSMIEAAVTRWDRLDGVAAIAGLGRHGSLLKLDADAIAGEISGKVTGLLNVVRPAVPHLTKTDGTVVALTAPSALLPDPAMGAVAAGRAAIASAVQSLAMELAPTGVRVNAIGVGMIDTPRQRSIYKERAPQQDYARWLQLEATRRRIPLGRPGLPREVAAAIVFLLSPVSSYTTGLVLDVTGGLRSR